MTTPTELRHVHAIDLPIRRWVETTVRGALAVLAVVLAWSAKQAGTALEARSAILVSASILCAPIAVAGLAGIWWGILVMAPTGLLLDHLTSSEQ